MWVAPSGPQAQYVVSLVREQQRDTVLVSSLCGGHVPTHSLLLALHSPLLARLLAEDGTGMHALTLPFTLQVIKGLVNMMQGGTEKGEDGVREVAAFLDISLSKGKKEDVVRIQETKLCLEYETDKFDPVKIKKENLESSDEESIDKEGDIKDCLHADNSCLVSVECENEDSLDISAQPSEGRFPSPFGGPRRKSFWKYFVEEEGDPSTVICLISGCEAKVSRGKAGSPSGRLSSWGLKAHLMKWHLKIWEKIKSEKETELDGQTSDGRDGKPKTPQKRKKGGERTMLGIVEKDGFFQCDECDLTYKSSSGLWSHKQTIHEGVFFYCDQCNYKAGQTTALKLHKQCIHELKYEYVCDQCDFKAACQTNLNKHIANKHEEPKFLCHLCDFKCARRKYLINHVGVKHEGVRYACDQCEYKATRQDNLVTHKRKVHSKDQILV